jgi:hypothetical protein
LSTASSENVSPSNYLSEYQKQEPVTSSNIVVAPPQTATNDPSSLGPDSIERLNRALVDALNSGRSVSWSAEDQRGVTGYAAVSETRMYGAQECRSYRYTIVRESEQLASRDGMACREAGGAWNLQVR